MGYWGCGLTKWADHNAKTLNWLKFIFLLLVFVVVGVELDRYYASYCKQKCKWFGILSSFAKIFKIVRVCAHKKRTYKSFSNVIVLTCIGRRYKHSTGKPYRNVCLNFNKSLLFFIFKWLKGYNLDANMLSS